MRRFRIERTVMTELSKKDVEPNHINNETLRNDPVEVFLVSYFDSIGKDTIQRATRLRKSAPCPSQSAQYN